MGTNWYIRVPACESPCDHCSQNRLVHLGKSSAGWRFLFKSPGESTQPFEDWMDQVTSNLIEDENGCTMEVAEFLFYVMGRQDGLCYCLRVLNRFHDKGFCFARGEFF